MGRRILAIDLGGTRVRSAVWDVGIGLRGKREEPTDHGSGPAGVVAQIIRMARASVASVGIQWSTVEQAGVASPGPLDTRTGIVFSPPNMPGWHDEPLRAELEAGLGVPATVVNDANAAALGEYLHGAGRGCANLVYLTVSTGIGGGVIVNGTLMEGSSGTAGELGHVTLDRRGPVCKCGNIGCLEALASGTAIGQQFSTALAAGQHSLAEEWLGGKPPTAGDVARAAAAGDQLAAEIFAGAAETIGLAVVSFIHAFNPDVIALGGGVTHAGDLLFAPIRRMVASHTMTVPRNAARVVPAELGDDVGLIGAAEAALAATPPESC